MSRVGEGAEKGLKQALEPFWASPGIGVVKGAEQGFLVGTDCAVVANPIAQQGGQADKILAFVGRFQSFGAGAGLRLLQWRQ